MDSVRAAAYPSAGDATTGKPDCYAAPHGSTDLHLDARLEPDSHADANSNADADAGALGEPDGYAVKDANVHAHPNDIAHTHADGVAHGDSIADAQPHTTTRRWNVLSAQQPDAADGRYKLPACPAPADGL